MTDTAPVLRRGDGEPRERPPESTIDDEVRPKRHPLDFVDWNILVFLTVISLLSGSYYADGSCRDEVFADDNILSAAIPSLVWHFGSALSLMARSLKTRVTRNRWRGLHHTDPDNQLALHQSSTLVLAGIVVVAYNEISVAHFDSSLSTLLGSSHSCDENNWESAASSILAAIVGAFWIQLFLTAEVALGIDFGAFRYRKLPDLDSQLIVLIGSSLVSSYSATLLAIIFDVQGFWGLWGLSGLCTFCVLGSNATLSKLLMRIEQDRNPVRETRQYFMTQPDAEATEPEAHKLFWKHLRAALLHLFSLGAATVFLLQSRRAPSDTNLEWGFKQYDTLLRHIVFVDLVVIVCHGVRLWVWYELKEKRKVRMVANPWRFDAVLRIVEYTATAGLLLLQFNSWCAWQDAESSTRDWDDTTSQLGGEGWFWAIIAVNAALQIVGSAHEFSQSVSESRFPDPRYPQVADKTKHTVANTLAYVLMAVLFLMVFFVQDATPGSSRILPLRIDGTDTQSCQASLQSNAEASGHIRSAWRFLVTVTVMLYLLFGAVDSLRDAHKRAVYFTELGCITKIGVAWGIVLLKAGTVPFENGTGVIAYPSVFALMLLPGVVATLVMLAPGPGR